jgi:hypothetical protein
MTLHADDRGLAAWLGFHCTLTGVGVPEAGSDRRDELRRRFDEALDSGYTVEDLRDASRRQALLLLPEGAFQFLPPAS